MEIHFHINLNRPRWTQHWSRRRKLVVSSTLALFLIPSLIVLAHHLPFTDIPTSGALHNAVGAIYGAGITAGTTATTYSPNDPINRGQMAFFLHRGLGRVAYVRSPFDTNLTDDEIHDIIVLSITTGGVSGGTGFVKADAAFTAYYREDAGCPCELIFYLSADGGPSSQTHRVTLYTTSSDDVDSSGSGAATLAFPLPTGSGPQNVRLQAKRIGTTGTADTILARGEITALYVPFGSTGANTLAAQPGEGPELPAAPPGEQGVEAQMKRKPE